jgi:hypothetical protein
VGTAVVPAAWATTGTRLRELRPYLSRLVRWQPVVATATVALFVGRLGSIPPVTKETTMAVLIALGTCALLDDPAEPVLASSPSTRRWRRGLRLALAAPVAGGLWWVAGAVATSPSPLPILPAAMEVAALVAVALAAAALALQHDARSSGAAFAGPAVLGFVMAVSSLPDRWALFPAEGHEVGWAAVAVLAVVAGVGASRDPASAPVLRWPPRRDGADPA